MRVKRSIREFLAMLMVLGLSQCGSSGLNKESVTNIPDGDATGSAASGTYGVSMLTTNCAGNCPAEFGICEVGYREDETVVIVQTEGHLRADIENNPYVSLLQGGIYADGAFEIGGFRTVLGGAGSSVALFKGAITKDGTVTATGQLHATGSYEEINVDCNISTELTGQRR